MQEKKFIDYTPGETLGGKKIKSIFASSNNYIIYSDTKSKTAINYSTLGISESCFTSINAPLTELNGIMLNLKKSHKYNGQIATAMVECFNNNPESAIQIIDTLKLQARKDVLHQAKINYLLWTLLLVVFNTVLSLGFFYSKHQYNYGPFLEYFLIATFGSYGGFISTLYKINKLNFEEENNRTLLFYLSISRIFLAMLSSIIVYVLIKSNVLLGVLNNVENIYVFYIFAVVAGFSETFIPDILRKIENKSSQYSETSN